ncbi:hypothetical protein Ciccas_006112 [Cichlidogyrus casuarinus]|uniref:CXXC-type domain-containing protein n=1 Tax=Cichlidogyrus casuarinus TaxID=1844966 RepID=A0ABD2Q7R3_9PLAT
MSRKTDLPVKVEESPSRENYDLVRSPLKNLYENREERSNFVQKSACLRCNNCRRTEDCGACDFCFQKGGTKQTCRLRQCVSNMLKRTRPHHKNSRRPRRKTVTIPNDEPASSAATSDEEIGPNLPASESREEENIPFTQSPSSS